jgi:hypothetical protein
MNSNNGILVVNDAVSFLVDMKVFSDREHARNTIYSTIYNRKNELTKVREGIYQMKNIHLGPKEHSVRLNNPIAFKPGVSKILQEAKGEALGRVEIWKRMQALGIKSKSSDPLGWVDFTARQIKAESVAPHVWRWKPAETPIKQQRLSIENIPVTEIDVSPKLQANIIPNDNN